MLGRAVQLTFPFQAANDEVIRDTKTAGTYLLMALHLPPSNTVVLTSHELQSIRDANRDGSYMWGDYLSLKLHPPPDLRLLNMENAVTTSTTNYDVPLKGINYHMHVNNVPLVFKTFAAATFTEEDEPKPTSSRPIPYVISMANNHAMDFGHVAFEQETLPALDSLPGDGHIVGIGDSISSAAEATSIALPQPNRRLKCIAVSTVCSGTPPSWRATATKPGMIVLPALDEPTAVQKAVEATASVLQANSISCSHQDDLVVLSIHWGPNWAYREAGDVEAQTFRREYAHRVIDELGVDLIYGHSSHHIRGMELYRGKLIIYGAGDLVNDYEGFANRGDEAYNKLGALFLVDVNVSDGTLAQLCLIPTFMNCLQLQRVQQRSYKRWDPTVNCMVERADGVTELCEAVNHLSRLNAGNASDNDPVSGVAVELRVEDDWASAPGGPVLVFTPPDAVNRAGDKLEPQN